MIHPRAPRIHLRHHLREIPWSSALLGLMALLVLLMPVNYRAGTATDHPHTIFQPVIDRITGHPHHHPGEDEAIVHDDVHPDTALSPFAPPAIPLNALQRHDAPTEVAMEAADPDVPTVTTLKSAADQPLLIAAMAGMLLLVAVALGRRAPWPGARPLRAITTTPELPPPRMSM